MNQEVTFENEVWNSISKEAKDFISNCLLKDPKERLSSFEAMSPSWFSNQTEINSNICVKVLSNLKLFRHVEPFKKLVIKSILSNFLSLKELKRLRKIFQGMDLDNTGYISIDDLQEAFKKGNIKITEKELNTIIKNCDDQKNGKLDYSEFLVGGLDEDFYINRAILEKVFKYFDIDDNGFICIDDLQNAFKRSGEEIKQIYELKSIIENVAKGKDTINLEEFLSIFNISS